MSKTADDLARAVAELAGSLPGEPTAEQVAPLLAGLSRRERAVVALFFESLAEGERGLSAAG